MEKGLEDKHKLIERMQEYYDQFWVYSDHLRITPRISSVLVRPQGVYYLTDTGLMFSGDRDDYRDPFKETLTFGGYEVDELEFIGSFLNKNSVVLDIGANVGWYALHLAKMVPGGKVFAFEPVPYIFTRLKENIDLNKFSNIIPCNFGLSNKTIACDFNYSPSFPGASSLQNLLNRPDNNKIPVCLVRLDALDLKIKRLDFIKVDVEGAEKFVLEGAEKTLKRFRPILMVEMLRKWEAKFNYRPGELIKKLKGLGYACYIASSGKLKRIREITTKTKQTNFFFIPGGRHAK